MAVNYNSGMQTENFSETTELKEQTYYNLARLGKNEWWRYLLSFLLIIICWMGFSLVLGSALSLIIFIDSNPATGFDLETGHLIGVSPLVELAVGLISFIPLLISLFIAVKFIHRRPISSLITPYSRIDWKRVFIGMLSILFLVSMGCLLEAILFPGRYQFTFNPGEYIKYVPLIVIFIPIQAATEELLMRGYLTQSLNLLTKRPWIAIGITSILFMLLHFANPEVAVDVFLTLAYYFAVGVFMGLIALKDNRLELALGCHIGINLFVLVANYSDSVLPVSSIFTVTKLDPVYNLISFLVIAVIFYVALLLINTKRQQKNMFEG